MDRPAGRGRGEGCKCKGKPTGSGWAAELHRILRKVLAVGPISPTQRYTTGAVLVWTWEQYTGGQKLRPAPRGLGNGAPPGRPGGLGGGSPPGRPAPQKLSYRPVLVAGWRHRSSKGIYGGASCEHIRNQTITNNTLSNSEHARSHEEITHALTYWKHENMLRACGGMWEAVWTPQTVHSKTCTCTFSKTSPPF